MESHLTLHNLVDIINGSDHLDVLRVTRTDVNTIVEYSLHDYDWLLRTQITLFEDIHENLFVVSKNGTNIPVDMVVLRPTNIILITTKQHHRCVLYFDLYEGVMKFCNCISSDPHVSLHMSGLPMKHARLFYSCVRNDL
ncbi:hypothetical protein AL387_gp196 [Salmon gill poxvirus]|uniref:Uncharacterized protein n=1 Tax=Salmon gill poxvirus TaxID=1680908 RepID=A0A0H4Y1E8_9POXV|nr:hypothetical protein AL387_gp196 [Salmon gill poxvirus]AKR04320.1 hypothetical protein SGPV196 [Salmon gill poxvirus]